MPSCQTVLPLVPFGNAYWYSLLLNNKKTIVDVHENFLKQTFRNRFEILTSQGVRFLSVPVISQKGIKIPLNEIQIFEDDYWKSQHLKTITSVYNSSPFFLYYKDELQKLYEKKHNTLSEFCLDTFNMITECLELETELKTSEEYINNSEEIIDYRNIFKPSTLKKSLNESLFPRYIQVYESGAGFHSNLSILDLLFNLGPETEDYLEQISLLNILKE